MERTYILSNGTVVPALGLSTFRLLNGSETTQAVLTALQSGYRKLDCAAVCGNEPAIADAIAASGIPRSELFITGKLWNNFKGYDAVIKAFERTLEALQLDYLDLYTIHWPIAKASKQRWQQANAEAWRAFESLYRDGRIKALGVTNFLGHHLDALLSEAGIAPMVNQLEYHPGCLQEETIRHCRTHNIAVEAWAPLANGTLLQEDLLVQLADKYGRTPSQIALRWSLQNGVSPLPRAATIQHITENFQIFDFELLAEDMKRIDSLPISYSSGLHPDEIDF
ncbi:MAG: aldo/keto reductase [Lachnospiraceae bacterium]